MIGLLLAAAAAAAPTPGSPLLGDPFRDHAVLQRGRSIPVWGRARPGETVTVRLAGASTSARADRTGEWHARLPAMPAGGPYALRATSASGAAQDMADVLVGDVFLCSGQSNMELPVKQALNAANELLASPDDGVRLMTVAHATALTPLETLPAPAVWSAAAADTAADFSAACFFMARNLRKLHPTVPLGLIHSSWGGTPINAWRSEVAVATEGRSPRLALLDAYRRDPAAAERALGGAWELWWSEHVGTAAERAPWRDPGAEASWAPVPSLSDWQLWPDPAMRSYRGVVWYRASVGLTAAQARNGAAFLLGRVSRNDRIWVNGVTIGGGFIEGVRRYTLPPGLLKPGENAVTIAVWRGYGRYGLTGGDAFHGIETAGGERIAATRWRYRRSAPTLAGTLPQPPWIAGSGLAILYNAMIAPLRDYGLAGVAWYQGEQDRDEPKPYQTRLAGLMAEWRAQFGRPDLPFLIAQLSTIGPRSTAPEESPLAEIREAQRRAVAGDRHAALAVTADLGEAIDIHPANKQDVGARLARAARFAVYGEVIPASGPRPAEAVRAGDAVEVRFADVTAALATLGGSHAVGFQLCGAEPGSCRWADATVRGATARLETDGQPATRVRFCWAETPVCNVVDGSGLPAQPFEQRISP